MFDTKQKQLFEVKAKKEVTSEPKNLFIHQGKKQAATIRSTNGAVKYSELDDALTTQFGSMSIYKQPRSFKDISLDMSRLYEQQGPLNTIKFSLFLRMITRKCQFPSGKTTEETQRGGGLRHEGLVRMIWLHTQNPNYFWNNVELLIAAGSWKDIIQIMSYDLQFNGWDKRTLNWNKFGDLLLTGLENPNTRELIKKYLPQIKAKSACKTLESQADNLISKWICSLLYGNKPDNVSDKVFYGSTYKKYRQLKSSGTAHEWQQLISQKKFDRIDFNKIHGRALSLLTKGKFLENSKLTERYAAWITKPETKAVKFTGYMYELFKGYNRNAAAHIKETINKQFLTFVDNTQLSKEVNHFIVVRDTSGSMGGTVAGTQMSAFDIAKVMALYFSHLLSGYFKNHFIEFNSNAKLLQWTGQNPTDKWDNDRCSYLGSTNFLNVINLFVTIRKGGVPEGDFPKGIICISDGEFNASPQSQKTNLQSARDILLKGGFSADYVSKFIVVLWNLPTSIGRNAVKFETYEAGIGGLYYFGGFDGSIINFLTNEEVKTAKDLALSALDQELLNMVSV